MQSSGITVYTETSSSFIPFILHEEIHEILPVLILQKTKSSSSNSTCRRQGDLLSSPQRPTRHSRHSSGKTLHRHSSSTRTFQTFQSFMTFQPYKYFYTFQHLPVHQYLPVLSSVSRDSTHSSISSIRMLILHTDWFPPETPLSASRIQDITLLQTFILQRKGDVAISVKR